MSDDGNGRGADGDRSGSGPPSAREILASIQAEADAVEEQPAPPSPARRFRVEDAEWIARLGGGVAYGTGVHGAAPLDAIVFARAGEPDRPVRECLLPRGRFEGCYDEELAALLRGARALERGGGSPRDAGGGGSRARP